MAFIQFQYSDSPFQAPGEAEAELAMLNSNGTVDAIMTSDGDAWVFGARTIIRPYVVDFVKYSD